MISKWMPVALVLAGSAAHADISVAFQESAPKDRFTISNLGACAVQNLTLHIDLDGSQAGLIFDVTGAGAGVEVFQPLELVKGKELLGEIPTVEDGDTDIRLPIRELAPGGEIAFTIDVDDTAGVSETMVSGAEITGASVTVSQSGTSQSAMFDKSSSARVLLDSCSA